MLLTFDIEDWFHILDPQNAPSKEMWRTLETRFDPILDDILKLLAKNNQIGIFFVLGWIAKRYPDCVRKILDHGHIIGSHSYSHTLIFNQSFNEFLVDTKKSIDILSAQAKREITMYRAPGFSIRHDTLWAFEALIKLGITKDFSVFGAKRFHGGLDTKLNVTEPFIIKHHSIELEEYPINVKKLLGWNFVYSGGGYFRIFNRHILKNFILNDPYVMSYFHPRDFDYGQPRLPNLSIKDKIRYYIGLKTSFSKFNYLLKTVKIEEPEQFFIRHKPKISYRLKDI